MNHDGELLFDGLTPLRFVLEGRAVTRILRHLDLPTTAPPMAQPVRHRECCLLAE